MCAWISYQSGEVQCYHPICERALTYALRLLCQDTTYEVLHHQNTGTLEMDYVIRNRLTHKYLCVFEVKRTPTDIQSMRYQWQAMSYVANSLPIVERPYYVITNLEYSFVFRYDVTRQKVTKQMLEPGLLKVGKFQNFTQSDFELALGTQYSKILDSFIHDRYRYMVTLDQFEQQMEIIKNDFKLRKSSLAVYFYEYIRGAFDAVGRKDLPTDIRVFRNDVKSICDEAARIDFSEIFTYNTVDFEPKITVNNAELSNVYNYGNQTISADSVVEILHRIVSDGHEHDRGEVPTDLELATFVSILAKYKHGEILDDEVLCDPAVGSGNLISTAVNVFNLTPKKVKVNDINHELIELLSLRLGLLFPEIINKTNCAEISLNDITDLTKCFFDNVGVVIMNPPFVAGINCVDRKSKFIKAIRYLSHNDPITNVGQMNLEGLFIELICELIKEGTTVSCIIPATHLTARGPEGIAFRKMLIEKFGLSVVFNYPMDGLFEDVIKGTCVIVGKKGASPDDVEIITAYEKISDIDINEFLVSLSENKLTDEFSTLIPGVQARLETKKELVKSIKDGWRGTSKEMFNAIMFIQSNLYSIAAMKPLEDMNLNIWRGPLGNTGGSDLLFIKEGSDFYLKNESILKGNIKPALRSGKYADFLVDEGDSRFFDVSYLDDKVIYIVIDDYMTLPIREGSQPRATKTRKQYLDMLKQYSTRTAPVNSVLIPRLPRSGALSCLTNKKTYISTNYIIVENKTDRDAIIMATWVNTIFYLLECEISSKNQDGVRKMEKEDVLKTYVPDPNCISDDEYSEIMSSMSSITGRRELANPGILSIDKIWATILFGKKADEILNETKRLLIMLVNMRNRD